MSLLLLLLTPNSLPGWRWFRGGTRQWRESEGERKGTKELRHGTRSVPQVSHYKGGGMDGTGKQV